MVNTGGHPLEQYRASRWPPLSIVANLLQRRWVNARLRQLAAAFKPSLVLVTKGEEITPATLRWIKRRVNAHLANWNPDSPLNPLNTTSDLLDTIPLYDDYYIWGKFLLPELERLGARRPAYLPFAYDPDLHQPRALSQEERAQWGNALTFVGTWERAREEALNAVVDFDLGIWGNHWSRLAPGSALRRCWRGEAHGEKLSRVYSASSIALNFIREQNGSAHNMRTFEAPVCGIMLLTTRTEEQVELLGEDRGAVFFGNVEEMRSKAGYYLAHPERREAVAAEGRHRLASGHTYADRMAVVMAAADRGPG